MAGLAGHWRDDGGLMAQTSKIHAVVDTLSASRAAGVEHTN
jgi:hypothetical protein